MDNLETDLLVVGGGINGCAIAADAAGRGLSVILCEKGDLASATSSWSSKLIHGGVRYLENYEFKLVRKSLQEREILLGRAPHLIHPIEFVMPHESHLRPSWMIRIGLWLYDHLAKTTLPKSRALKLRDCPEGDALQSQFSKGFRYTDCRTNDTRLVVLNALSAADNGASILTQTTCIEAKRLPNVWHVQLKNNRTGEITNVSARCVVNATGPWVKSMLSNIFQIETPAGVRLVKGSHIILPKLYPMDVAYILQTKDQRVVFAIPYQNDYTLIGTTEVDYNADPSKVAISKSETKYLCSVINQYFQRQICEDDVVSDYAGVRTLFDDDSNDLSKISRDSHLELNANDHGAPILSVFGGKLTTHRTLAEDVLSQLKPYFPDLGPAWTAHQPLPGGNLPNQSFANFLTQLQQEYHWLPKALLIRYAEQYGTRLHLMLENRSSLEELGQHFGGDLYQCEVDFLINEEWALSSDDILWRRTKLGLIQASLDMPALDRYITNKIH